MEISIHTTEIIYFTRRCSSQSMNRSLSAKKVNDQEHPGERRSLTIAWGRRFRDMGEGGGGGRFPSRRTDTRPVGLTRMSFRTCDLECTAS